MIGIVVGLAAEARIARHLGGQTAVGGGGTRGALEAARRLIEQGATGLVSFGLAGGLDPTLPAGAVIVPEWVLGERGERWPTDRELRAALETGLGRGPGGTVQTLLATETIIGTAAAKRALWQRHAAAAADMESGVVAAAAQQAGLPFAVLRAICDPAGADLPPAAMTALDDGGRIGAWRLLRSLALDPAQIGALVRLGAQAATARRTLLACAKLAAPHLQSRTPGRS